MNNQKARWGIAGLGKIAHRFVSDLTMQVDNAELYAVAARDKQRADSFSNQYGCQRSYGSYTELANDANVDIVYIATIHPFHKGLVELFLNKGKHVLVEKPAFTNLQDWDAMSTLAEEKGLLLAEAMKTVAFPAYQAMKQFIKENKVEINAIEASFGNWHEFDSDWHLFNPTLCGGATLDVGVYGLWFYADLCRLTNTPIEKPTVEYVNDNSQSEVDENVVFKFDGQIKGEICASITRDLKREAIIRGPELEIVIHNKWWNPKTIDISFKGEQTQITAVVSGGGFEYEIEHISSLILNKINYSDVMCKKTSRQVISIMEASLVENGFDYLVCSKPSSN
ncbi:MULTISPECIES: Gfo/Idh/MocA family protein [unclassified Photobacterium]|uniref:Gfo/Idh/MocA family protein n=1 Tax=unclassified Photobacterium TaxID=2628852 RepID=UPI000D17DED4|nr:MULTISPECIES: Gfo/Idh/MocA family oxidoreductase [unclassified Photobacterium]PSV30016.1 oxidoreductase [Photobacterium sp. GB-72]PSV37998.1 oxidoreductase [Photobacterium sp. GB-210]